MKCDELKENLSAYADGELAGRARCEIEAHLRTCAACAVRLHHLRLLQDKLHEGALTAVQAPDIADAVMARVSDMQTAPGSRVVRRSWAAACAALVLGAAVFLSHAQHNDTTKRMAIRHRAVRPTQAKRTALVPPSQASPRPNIQSAAQTLPPLRKRRPSAVQTAPSHHIDMHFAQCFDARTGRVVTVVRAQIAGVTIERSTAPKIIQPPRPDPDAETIVRPPLRVVTASSASDAGPERNSL